MGWTGNNLVSFAILCNVWLSPWECTWRHSWLDDYATLGKLVVKPKALRSKVLAWCLFILFALRQPAYGSCVKYLTKPVGHASPRHGRKPSFMESKHKPARNSSPFDRSVRTLKVMQSLSFCSVSKGTRHINKPKPQGIHEYLRCTASFRSLPWMTWIHGML